MYLEEDSLVEAATRTVDVSRSLQGWVLKQKNQWNVKWQRISKLSSAMCTLFTSDKMTSSLVLWKNGEVVTTKIDEKREAN